MAKNIKLSYWDFPGGRGEDCRIALHIAGVDFEDNRINGPMWSDLKSSTPFGALPVLEVDGEALAQSNAILRLIGTRHELHPRDDWQAARHDALMGAAEDLRTRLTPILAIKEEDEKKAKREAFANDYMHTWAADVDKQIEGPFVAGDKLNVVDLKLYVLVKWFAKGGVDHIPADVFASAPKLMALYDAVENHPKVKDWYAR
jgi:glutathione S-transferase